eukprot:TRINITY_DN501_c0_g1_i1.p1 TRINITY_DN501_c0_g1~~TRINITY_DN501_c0_g1_i1.p1  ORF type:complete len:509 (+),score=164.39 TRINITY_DN501_c0_g1_i1:217-1743(+)
MATALNTVLGAAKQRLPSTANLTDAFQRTVPAKIREASYEEISKWFFYGVLGLFVLITLRAVVLARRTKEEDSDDEDEDDEQDDKAKARSRLQTAMTYLHNGRLKEAQALFEAVGKMADEQKDMGLQHEVIVGLAVVYEHRGDMQRSTALRVQAARLTFDLTQKAPADRNASFMLAQSYLHTEEFGKAAVLLEHTYNLANQVNDKNIVAHSARLMSQLQQAAGQVDKSVELLEKALKPEIFEPAMECEERTRLARMYLMLGRGADSIKELDKVAAICRTVDDAVGEVAAATRKANVVRDMGDIPTSVPIFLKCIQDAEKLDPKHIQVRWEARIAAAIAYRRLNEHPKALILLEEAVKLAQQIGPMEEHMTRNDLGLILREMNLPEKALEQFQLAANTKKGDRYHAVHFNLGACCVALKQLPRAAEEFEKCAALCSKVGDRQLEMKALAELAGFFTMTNQQDKLQKLKERVAVLQTPPTQQPPQQETPETGGSPPKSPPKKAAPGAKKK